MSAAHSARQATLVQSTPENPDHALQRKRASIERDLRGSVYAGVCAVGPDPSLVQRDCLPKSGESGRLRGLPVIQGRQIGKLVSHASRIARDASATLYGRRDFAGTVGSAPIESDSRPRSDSAAAASLQCHRRVDVAF